MAINEQKIFFIIKVLAAQFKTERKAIEKKKPSRLKRGGSDILKLEVY